MIAHASVPSWLGVATSVLLVGACLAVVLREHLGLGREVLVAAVRAVVQLAAVGALLGVLFRHAGLLGALAWVTGMVAIGGRVAANRGRGACRQSRAWSRASSPSPPGAASAIAARCTRRAATKKSPRSARSLPAGALAVTSPRR